MVNMLLVSVEVSMSLPFALYEMNLKRGFIPVHTDIIYKAAEFPVIEALMKWCGLVDCKFLNLILYIL